MWQEVEEEEEDASALLASYIYICFQVYLFKQGMWCAFILLPLLVVVGVTWTLRRAADSHWKLDIATNVHTEVLGRFPVPEVVSCVNCSSSAPAGGRLVWRAVSNAGHEALLGYPDLLRDAYAIWAPCPRLTVLVTSAPERRAQRDAIRTTWGRPDRHSNCSHRVVFFMSAQSRSKQYSDLKYEYRPLKDIVVQARVADVPEPTWWMSALLVEWVPTHVSGSRLALRVTDDTYVNVPALLAAVDSLPTSDERLRMYGRLSSDRTHLEDCVYMAKSDGFRQLQLPFADVVAANRSDVPLVTGPLARKAGLSLVQLDGIGSCDVQSAAIAAREWLRKGGASSSHLTVRGMSPELMATLHREVSKLELPVSVLGHASHQQH
ncbi:uncharacterized protein [Dermacentor albipictus]|uniref:uncharacterized protein isoform X2 n=1 Tax=Dermacentor albipictus TaxID=60249 RepID=UPI0031FD09B2